MGGGTKFTTAGGEYTFEVLPDLESGVIEARINRAILSIPECGQCENCVNKGTVKRCCVKRLEERHRLLRIETNLLFVFWWYQQKTKDRNQGRRCRTEESKDSP